MSPTPDNPPIDSSSFLRKLTPCQWEEDPELASFLSFKSLEEIALGHTIKGFICSHCNYYNKVKDSESEDEE
jgi:hypothetical protein